MKKVAILAFWTKEGGGVYQYTQSIIDALKTDKANSYVVFCFENENAFDNYPLEIRKIEKFKNNGLMKAVRLFQFIFFIQKPWFINSTIQQKFDDIDLVISPCISEYPHFYLKKKFIFTLHDMQERYYPKFFSRYVRFTRKLYNRTLTKVCSHVLCESSYVKSDIEKFTGTPASKISVIPAPPPQDFLQFQIQENQIEKIREKYNLPKKYIFYPAQCWEHKNHLRLVEAFKKVRNSHPDVELILTGSQQNNFLKLVEKIAELNLDTSVKHLGFIDYLDFPYLYKSSLFLVMPTLFESVSIPIYEAFSLEVAVCASNVVALPEQVGDAGLIFDPTDVNDIADKMLMLVNDENLRTTLAKKGLDKVKNFNHSAYSQKLFHLIGSL